MKILRSMKEDKKLNKQQNFSKRESIKWETQKKMKKEIVTMRMMMKTCLEKIKMKIMNIEVEEGDKRNTGM